MENISAEQLFQDVPLKTSQITELRIFAVRKEGINGCPDINHHAEVQDLLGDLFHVERQVGSKRGSALKSLLLQENKDDRLHGPPEEQCRTYITEERTSDGMTLNEGAGGCLFSLSRRLAYSSMVKISRSPFSLNW